MPDWEAEAIGPELHISMHTAVTAFGVVVALVTNRRPTNSQVAPSLLEFPAKGQH